MDFGDEKQCNANKKTSKINLKGEINNEIGNNV